MYQPKVKGIHKHSDNHEEDMVCKGKLKFIYQPISQGGKILKPDGINRIYKDGYELKPIIVSDTNEIEIGDLVYHEPMFTTGITGIYKAVEKRSNGDFKFIFIEDSSIFYYATKSLKILALPEQFSDKHLQAIVDGKMKDGDEVLVKCSFLKEITYGNMVLYDHNGDGSYWFCKNCEVEFSKSKKELLELNISLYQTHTNQQNQITLFPAKQSLEEAAWDHVHDSDTGDPHEAFIAGVEWAKKNNY